MTPRVSINAEQITVDDIWKAYETTRASIMSHANRLKQSLVDDVTLNEPEFLGMSLNELDAYFEEVRDEADCQASLFIIAAAEATIRVDFLERVYKRRKDSVSQTFRDIYKSRCDHSKVKVRLAEDILDIWAENLPRAKNPVGTFKGALRFRDWLAHGRYWVPKLGQKYDPNGLAQIVTDLFNQIGVANN